MNRIVRAQVYRHDMTAARQVRRSPLGARRTEELWHPVGSVEAFRVLRDGAEMEGAPLAINVRTDRLRFDLAAPLEGAVPIIEAHWRPGRMVFAALAPGPYVLAVGQRDTGSGAGLDARSVLASDDPAGMRLPVATVGTQAVRSQAQKLDNAEGRLYAAICYGAFSRLRWLAWGGWRGDCRCSCAANRLSVEGEQENRDASGQQK